MDICVAIEAIQMLELLSEDANVCFLDYTVTVPNGDTVKPSWILGLYLQSQ